jgi:hypothetical protein
LLIRLIGFLSAVVLVSIFLGHISHPHKVLEHAPRIGQMPRVPMRCCRS